MCLALLCYAIMLMCLALLCYAIMLMCLALLCYAVVLMCSLLSGQGVGYVGSRSLVIARGQ
jgi:hypothetical protein